MENYEKLKSGTDIRGRAIEHDGKPAILTDKAVEDIACAFVLWLSGRVDKPRIKLAIGRDSRLTGEHFTSVIINALKTSGVEIFDCALFSTPAAFMTTKFPSMAVDGSIMITASHHPYDINGLKFFTVDGGVNSADLDEIIAIANEGKRREGGQSTVVKRDFLRLYCDTLGEVIRKGTGLFMPLKNMKIVVDAGHGAGGFYATRVLKPLGADISASQFLEPDGNFPAHAPNPENAEAMDSLKNAVLENNADLGIIFDADVDRCAVVASDGTEINRCALIALAAAIVLPDHPGATIVTDSVTTEGLRQFIESKGGVQRRFKRGYRNVIDEAKRLIDEEGTDAPLAIESSGHAAFHDNYFLDDGAYFISRILVEHSNLRRKHKDLTDLIAELPVPLEEADIRLDFECDNWRDIAEKIITRLTGLSERLLTLSDDNHEGVRAFVKHGKGYFIVRTSVHDPVLPIYIEADKEGGALTIAKFLYSFLRGFRGLNVTPLEQYIEEHTPDEQPEDGEEQDVEEELPEEMPEEAFGEEAEEYAEAEEEEEAGDMPDDEDGLEEEIIADGEEAGAE